MITQIKGEKDIMKPLFLHSICILHQMLLRFVKFSTIEICNMMSPLYVNESQLRLKYFFLTFL